MSQIEYFGYGAIHKLPDVLRAKNLESIFLITGRESFQISGAKEKILPALSRLKYLHFNQTSTNPDIKTLTRTIQHFSSGSYDCILAVGGGSIIDLGKLVKYFSNANGDLKDIVENDQILKPKDIPLIVIPTTAGTGSEATHFAVLYIGKEKYSIAHPNLLPDIAIMDPDLTSSISQYQAATGMLDTLSQSIESLWSINSTPVSREYAISSLRIISRYIPGVVETSSKTFRGDIMSASNLSGKAIDISKTTAAHAISYPLTIGHNIPHGHAVGLTIGDFLVFNYHVTDEDVVDNRGALHVREAIQSIMEILDTVTVDETKQVINQFMVDNGIETRLRPLGITPDDIDDIINGVNSERMGNNPRKVSKEDLKKILCGIL